MQNIINNMPAPDRYTLMRPDNVYIYNDDSIKLQVVKMKRHPAFKQEGYERQHDDLRDEATRMLQIIQSHQQVKENIPDVTTREWVEPPPRLHIANIPMFIKAGQYAGVMEVLSNHPGFLEFEKRNGEDAKSECERAYNAVQSYIDYQAASFSEKLRIDDFAGAMEVKREGVRRKLDMWFKKLIDRDDTTLEKWVRNAEKGIFNAAIVASQDEKRSQNSLSANMRCWKTGRSVPRPEGRKLPEIYRRTYTRIAYRVITSVIAKQSNVVSWLVAGTVKPQHLGSMSMEQLYPEREAQRVQRFKEMQQFRILQEESAENCADGMYQCGKCHKRKTIFTEMQTRSADEPMTVFLTCLVCHHRWRM